MLDVTPLFAPLHVKNLALRNRIVMPPMETNYGLATEAARTWYGRRAAGGVGVVIVEATNVFKFGASLTAANLAPLVQAIHAGGAAAAIQLFPGVRGQEGAPADLSLADMEALVAQYAAASRICVAAGFDGIEPHGAHGYLLNRFFSPVHNRRTDAYGGSRAGRMRLALEIVAAVRPAVDTAGRLLLYRHTPVGDGYDIADSLELAQALVAAGVDILVCTGCDECFGYLDRGEGVRCAVWDGTAAAGGTGADA